MRIVLAYIDPGTGSLLIQSIVGGSLAVAYAGRRFVAKTAGNVRNLFARGQRKPADTSPTKE